ncbi:MAG: DNA-binding protein [Spirochaetes bacterium RBG_16_67_19]|nr:MAG: DNA-binding protein [Spirochaetes bacterium RBG_16_67_19]
MPGVLVDSSVILDVFLDDPKWAAWSLQKLEALAGSDQLFINPLIYAEVSIGFQRIEELEAAVASAGFRLLAMPKEALFLAGKAFVRYRRNRGVKRSPLPDFFIGAHAAVQELALLTRDPRRVQTYFPTVGLICP